MATANKVGSPFQCGGSYQVIRPLARSNEAKLVIRVDNADLTYRVIIRINGIVDAAHADFFLMGGEALSLSLEEIPSNAEYPITVLNTVGDPAIYFGTA